MYQTYIQEDLGLNMSIVRYDIAKTSRSDDSRRLTCTHARVSQVALHGRSPHHGSEVADESKIAACAVTNIAHAGIASVV